VKHIFLVLAMLGLVLAVHANAVLGEERASRPVYAADLVKVKITEEAAARSVLPEGLYSEAENFGFGDLDGFLDRIGGTAVIRAHRRLNDKAWEAKNGFDRWFLIRLDGKLSAEEALRACKSNPWLEDASFEYYAYAQITPNDNYYAQNWGHNNTGQGPGGGGAGFDSNAPEAWDQQQAFGSPDVVIAIIDTGVNYNHADLNDNCVPGYDYGSNDDNPMDTEGHGSQCAGVAAGETNNGMGVAGVAGGCSIMPIKVANNSGNMTFTAITNAITHAGDNDANVISMSLGAEGGTQEGDYPSCDAALYYAYNAGCVIFAATANSNTSTIAYPSNHPSVISVGAASPTGQRKSTTSSDGQYWWGSNYGVNIQDDPKAVDIMAATILPATTMGGGYSTDFNGTSCATPYAAGVAALILSKDISLTPEQVREAITTSATDMTIDGGAGWDRYTGYGMINADAALATIAPGMPTCVITAPEDDSPHDLGGQINVEVTAADTDGSIAFVAFYVDGSVTPLYTDNSAPYAWTWDTQGLTPGEHTVRAVAADNEANTREDEVDVILLLPPNEGFETGLFNVYPWTSTGANPWIIQSDEHYTGSFAARAGTITHNQDTSLSLALNVTGAGNISFFHKVSSEANYDYFRFFIDGVQQGQWSGNVNWSQQVYPVTAGLRTFTWTYYKDQGVNSGSDTAWLDQISFPPHSAPPFAPTNLTATALTPTSVALHWTDNSDNESEFYIERFSGSMWSLIDWAPANVTSAVNNGLNPLTQYSYRVRAANANGESAYTNIASATTLGTDSPDNVAASANANQVNVSWAAPAVACTGYEVWRFPAPGGVPGIGVWLGSVDASALGFTDADWHLQDPGAYLWEVIALGSTGNSAPSLSNLLTKEMNGIVLGSVTNLSGEPIAGAEVSCGTLSVTSNEYGVYTMSALPGIYALTATHQDYETVTQEGVAVVSDQQTAIDFELPLYTVAAPAFSPEPGSFTGPVDVTLACPTAEAEIRYTLDGSEPDAAAQLYGGAIHLEQSTVVKARAFKLNCAPSEIVTGIYEVTVSNSDPVAPILPGIREIYPNPFSSLLTIRLDLGKAGDPQAVSIYNLRGELVRRFSSLPPGETTLSWDGRDGQGRRLGSGLYFVRLDGPGLKQTRKIILK
jgi:hypothetical protein